MFGNVVQPTVFHFEVTIAYSAISMKCALSGFCKPENWENRNDPDLVQTFPKKWWVESDCTAPIAYINTEGILFIFSKRILKCCVSVKKA
jgi:hypothetical protein